MLLLPPTTTNNLKLKTPYLINQLNRNFPLLLKIKTEKGLHKIIPNMNSLLPINKVYNLALFTFVMQTTVITSELLNSVG